MIRSADAEDAAALGDLFRAYLADAMGSEWMGSAEQLGRDLASGAARIVVAEEAGSICGFAAWSPTYDFHHCIHGGTVEDMYVVPDLRGRGLGVRLVSIVAVQISDLGGVFLRGMAVESPAVRKLCGRIAVAERGVECTVSGRAFRRLSELHRLSLRDLARGLPERSWNYEA